ncbi:N-acetylmuramoyl-L-alanine amidase [Candidatus Riflebacteria bacterium]
MKKGEIRKIFILLIFSLSFLNIQYRLTALTKGSVTLNDFTFEGYRVGRELIVNSEDIASSFDAQINYFPMSRILTMSKNGKVIRVVIGKKQIFIFKKVFEMPLSAVSIEGKIYLPINFLFNKIVKEWGEQAQSSIKKHSPAIRGNRIKSVSSSIERNYTQVIFKLENAAHPVVRKEKDSITLLFKNMDSTFLLPVRNFNSPEVKKVTFQSPEKGVVLAKIMTKVASKFTFAKSKNPPKVMVNVINDQAIIMEDIQKPEIEPKKLTEIGPMDLPEPPPVEIWTIRTIVIDAAHGGNDKGNLGITGLKESNLNLDIARRLGQVLKSLGYQVFHTRPLNSSISGAARSNPTIEKRAILTNRLKADVLITLHCDFSQQSKKRGVQVYFYDFYEKKSQKVHYLEKFLQSGKKNLKIEVLRGMAKAIGNAIAKEHGVDKSSVITLSAPFRLLTLINAPAFHVEIGYLSNPLDSKKLGNSINRQKIAREIANAIHQYARTGGTN